MGGDTQIEAPGVRRTGAALALLRASHPEPTVMVTALAVALAVSTGRAAPGVAAVGAAVLAGAPSVGWHNDWLGAGGRGPGPLDGGAPGLVLQCAVEGDRGVFRPVRRGVPAAGRLRDAGRPGGL